MGDACGRVPTRLGRQLSPCLVIHDAPHALFRRRPAPSYAAGNWPCPRRHVVDPAACGRASAPASGDRAAGSDGTPLPLQDLKAAELLQLNARLTGDFDQMQGRRFVRALVPYGRTYYFLDGATQRGLAFDVLTEFERELANRVPKGTVPPKIVIIPTSRDRLLTGPGRGLRRHRGRRLHGDRGPAGAGGFLGSDQDRHPGDRRHSARHSGGDPHPGPLRPAGARPQIEQLLRGPGRPQCAVGTRGPGSGADRAR